MRQSPIKTNQFYSNNPCKMSGTGFNTVENRTPIKIIPFKNRDDIQVDGYNISKEKNKKTEKKKSEKRRKSLEDKDKTVNLEVMRELGSYFTYKKPNLTLESIEIDLPDKQKIYNLEENPKHSAIEIDNGYDSKIGDIDISETCSDNQRKLKEEKDFEEKRTKSESDVIVEIIEEGGEETDEVYEDRNSYFKIVDVLCERNNVKITQRELDMLEKNQFLNDQIIDYFTDFYLSQIDDFKRKDFYIFSCIFSNIYMNTIKNKETLFKWLRPLNFNAVKYLIFPIIYKSHFSLAILCNCDILVSKIKEGETLDDRKAVIVTFDSLKITSENRIGKFVKRTFRYILEYFLNIEVKNLKLSYPVITLNVPQQQNYTDCGVYVIHYVKTFLVNTPVFKEDNYKKVAATFEKSLSSTPISNRSDLLEILKLFSEANK